MRRRVDDAAWWRQKAQMSCKEQSDDDANDDDDDDAWQSWQWWWQWRLRIMMPLGGDDGANVLQRIIPDNDSKRPPRTLVRLQWVVVFWICPIMEYMAGDISILKPI